MYDLRGVACPLNYVKTKLKLEMMDAGERLEVWLDAGEPIKNVHYLAFVGNGLNTLNISATKIDTNLLLSGSVWWEPFGPYGMDGKSRNMYDDYAAPDKVRVRFGTSFTRSKEDRFSNLDIPPIAAIQILPDLSSVMY